jgi:putative DNA primase/helicase
MIKEALATGWLKMHEHRPEDMFTRQAGANFNPDAQCPTWRKAMNEWADPDLQRTIQQLFGISLTGKTDVQRLVILHGPGATGKSTMMEIAKAVFGSYAAAVPSDALMDDRHGAMEERKLASLPGVRLVLCSETKAGRSMDENFIKKLTGGDTLVARKLYGEAFNFKPEFHIWLSTNNRPVVRDTSDATWRRFIMIPFDKVVPENKRDLQLKEKLMLELDGILNWMVEGYLDYAENGLHLAQVVKDDLNQYRLEQDDIAQFFEETCEFDPSYNIGRALLYQAYVNWCEATNRRPLNNKLFKKELTERFKDKITEKQMGPKGAQEWRWSGVDTQLRLFNKKHEIKGGSGNAS